MREIMKISSKVSRVVFWGILIIVFTIALSYATNELMKLVKE